jgi:hypothetical protein
MRNLRLLDCNNNFVKMLEEEEARLLIKSGQATMRETGRRAVLTLKTHKSVEDYSGGNATAALSTTYTEHHAGQKICILKRVEPGGGFGKWDNDLTFGELRAGQHVSSKQRVERALAERARRNSPGMPERRAA